MVYHTQKFLVLDAPATLRFTVDVDINSPLAAAQAVEATIGLSLRDGQTVGSALRQEGATCVEIMVCDERDIKWLTEPVEYPVVFATVPIRQRSAPGRVLFKTLDKRLLRLWRAQVKRDDDDMVEVQGRPVPPAGEAPIGTADFDPLLYVPPDERARSDQGQSGRRLPHGRTEIDPVRLVHAISICSHLRDVKYFSEVLDDTYDYLLLDGDNALPERRRDNDPRRKTLQRAMARADMVCCSLTRRQFQRWRKDDAIRSINIYSDASPVTGSELQGIIIDVNFKDNTIQRILLPGSTLAYGH